MLRCRLVYSTFFKKAILFGLPLFTLCIFLEDHWTGWIIETINKDLWRCWVVKKINYVEFSLLWRLCPSHALFKGKKTSLGKMFHTNRRDYRSIKG